tara:strand:- start:31740 stop:32504 length:765 start_codon:yes stop_codon:yes gene_type:complete
MISKIDSAITFAIAKFGSPDDIIAEFSADYMSLQVSGPDDDAGYETAKTALDRVKRMRIDTENVRKELKKDALKYGKTVDAESNRIKALLEPIEKHLKTQADIVRLEKARLKAAADAEAKEILAERVKILSDLGVPVNLELVERMDADEFAVALMVAKKEFETSEGLRIEADQKQQRDAAELAELRTAKREAEAKADQDALSLRNKQREPIRKQLHQFADEVRSLAVPDALRQYKMAIESALDGAARRIEILGD